MMSTVNFIWGKVMESKIAVITGASSGIGKAVSKKLLENNFKIVACGRTGNVVFGENSENMEIVTSDLLLETTSDELLQKAINVFGGCDYLFVNAGTIESGTIETIDVDKICKMVRLKVESSYRIIYTFLKYFKKIGKGHIIITSSVLGTKTRENSGAYAGCNYALEALAESLRMELSDTDIQISCIEPGLVQTNLHKDWPVHPKELLNITNTLVPEDIAEVVMEIISKPSHIRIPKYMILPKGHKI